MQWHNGRKRYDAHSEDGPGESRVSSSMEQQEYRAVSTTAVNSENVPRSQRNPQPKWLNAITASDKVISFMLIELKCSMMK